MTHNIVKRNGIIDKHEQHPLRLDRNIWRFSNGSIFIKWFAHKPFFNGCEMLLTIYTGPVLQVESSICYDCSIRSKNNLWCEKSDNPENSSFKKEGFLFFPSV